MTICLKYPQLIDQIDLNFPYDDVIYSHTLIYHAHIFVRLLQIIANSYAVLITIDLDLSFSLSLGLNSYKKSILEVQSTFSNYFIFS